MKTIPLAKYKQPKLTTRKVWVGAYGGHYDAVVFFKNKPKISEFMTIENKTVGAMWLPDFIELYGSDCIKEILDDRLRPHECEVSKVVKIHLQGFWSEYGDLVTYEFRADGY